MGSLRIKDLSKTETLKATKSMREMGLEKKLVV